MQVELLTYTKRTLCGKSKKSGVKRFKLLSFECINKFCVGLKFCVLLYFFEFSKSQSFFFWSSHGLPFRAH